MIHVQCIRTIGLSSTLQCPSYRSFLAALRRRLRWISRRCCLRPPCQRACRELQFCLQDATVLGLPQFCLQVATVLSASCRSCTDWDCHSTLERQTSATPRRVEPSHVNLLGHFIFARLHWRRVGHLRTRRALDNMMVRAFSPDGDELRNFVHLLYPPKQHAVPCVRWSSCSGRPPNPPRPEVARRAHEWAHIRDPRCVCVCVRKCARACKLVCARVCKPGWMRARACASMFQRDCLV